MTYIYDNKTSIVKKISIIILSFLLVSAGFAQKRSEKNSEKERARVERKERLKRMSDQEEDGAIIFHRQTVFGFKLNTDGYGMFLEMARMKTSRKANLYSLELGERKHAKEERIASGGNVFSSSPYVFGKVNNFYYAKLGFSQQQIIGNKGNKNGVAVSAIYGGGFSAGLIKPYYLKITEVPGSTILKDVKYNSDDSLQFLDKNSIIGATGFSKGFGELKFVPGVFAKAALRFDYGRYNELVSAMEVGIHLEMYSQKIVQMVDVKTKQLFFSAYAAIEFGSRK